MQKRGSIAAVILALMLALPGIVTAGQTLGRIQAINPTTQEILLDDGSNLAIDQDTRIMIEGKEGTLEDLKEGNQVKASFQEKAGKNVATTLDVRDSNQGGMGTQSTLGSHGSMGNQSGSSYGRQRGLVSGDQRQ